MTATRACHLLEAAGANRPARSATEIRAFATCRDERLRLPAFLRHYRGLGVDRFFIVDNASSDGGTEYLIDQPDVHLFQTNGRYSESHMGTDWLNALLAEFGVGTWCLNVDIDELLIYPGSEEAGLRALTRYLDAHGYQALSCMLLDMYPERPLKTASGPLEDAGDLVAVTPFFDAGPYEKVDWELCPGVLISGGMRERIFHPEFAGRGPGAKAYEAVYYRFCRDWPWFRTHPPHRPPLLTKVPLVRWDEHSRFLQGNHGVTPKTVAPDTGVLLHFKLLHDFYGRAIRETARGEHYDKGSEYRRYSEKLRSNPDLSFMCDVSTRFESTAQLVRLGLMQETTAWRDARSAA